MIPKNNMQKLGMMKRRIKVTVVQITKEESMEIRSKFPETHIHITSKQTSHKRYWVEENTAVKKYLREKRGVTSRG